ncbi:MAG: hypothetical protein J6C62_03740 [Clostridia bacterium]|nr:hypothetical protein [Clostridia bacterium]
MKTIKRIIAVVLLIVTVLLVCYMCKTCSRLKGIDNTIEDYKNTAFYTEDGKITLVILEDYSANYNVEGNEIVLTFKEYKDGVLDFYTEENAYSFVALNDGSLFDVNTKEILIRSSVYEKENSV